MRSLSLSLWISLMECNIYTLKVSFIGILNQRISLLMKSLVLNLLISALLVRRPYATYWLMILEHIVGWHLKWSNENRMGERLMCTVLGLSYGNCWPEQFRTRIWIQSRLLLLSSIRYIPLFVLIFIYDRNVNVTLWFTFFWKFRLIWICLNSQHGKYIINVCMLDFLREL